MTDSSTLIEPILEDESDEDDEEDAEESSTEEDEQEITSPRNNDEHVKTVEPVSKKDSVPSESEVSLETEKTEGSAHVPSTDDGIPSITQSDSVESDVSETSIQQTDRVKRQSHSEAAFDPTFLSDAEEKDEKITNEETNDLSSSVSKDVSTESQRGNDISEETSANNPSAENGGDVNPALVVNAEDETSDSEAVVLDPRNIPSSDSEDEHDLPLDFGHSEPFFEDLNYNKPTEVSKQEDDESSKDEETVLLVNSNENLSNNVPELTAEKEEDELPISIPENFG